MVSDQRRNVPATILISAVAKTDLTAGNFVHMTVGNAIGLALRIIDGGPPERGGSLGYMSHRIMTVGPEVIQGRD